MRSPETFFQPTVSRRFGPRLRFGKPFFCRQPSAPLLQLPQHLAEATGASGCSGPGWILDARSPSNAWPKVGIEMQGTRDERIAGVLQGGSPLTRDTASPLA